MFAQVNFYKFTVGLGAGTSIAFADLQKKTPSFTGYGTVDYNITPFTSLGVEIQKGELAGGDIQYDAFHRQFINSYISGSLNLKYQLGEMLTSYQRQNTFLNAIRGLYVGAGVGAIKNKLVNVRYYGSNYYPGEDESTETIIPVNLGINFYLPDGWGKDRYIINVNLQTTMALGEGMDGYSSISSMEKTSNDIYSFFSLGVKYNFGPLGLDRRR
jgi:hypothetical protein